MITLRRSTERQHVRRGKQELWLSFTPPGELDRSDQELGVLAAFDEIRFPPGSGSSSAPRADAEIVTYVYRGALAQEDSTGAAAVLHTGEFQRMTAGSSGRQKETNASRSDWAHVFRIALHATEVGLGCAREQKRFAAAQRRNVLCAVASPDGRHGSLRILQDALVYSSVLDSGHHLIHALLPGRSAWLHVICGEVTLHDIILSPGDGAGVTVEPAVSLTAQTSAEILLVDLGRRPMPLAIDVV